MSFFSDRPPLTFPLWAVASSILQQLRTNNNTQEITCDEWESATVSRPFPQIISEASQDNLSARLVEEEACSSHILAVV